MPAQQGWLAPRFSGKRTWRVECRLPLAGLLHPITADQRNGTGLGLPKSRSPEDAATTNTEVHPREEPNEMIRHAPTTTAVPVTHHGTRRFPVRGWQERRISDSSETGSEF